MKIKNTRLKRTKGRQYFPRESCVYPKLSAILLGKLWRISATGNMCNVLPESWGYKKSGEVVPSPHEIQGKEKLALQLD